MSTSRRRLLQVGAMAVGVALSITGCGPSPSPSIPAAVTNAPTAVSSPSPSAGLSALPTETLPPATESPSPSAPPETSERWDRIETVPAFRHADGALSIDRVVVGSDGTLFSVGSLDDTRYNGSEWVTKTTAAGWTSPDGRAWRRTADNASLHGVAILDIQATNNGDVIGVGRTMGPGPSRAVTFLWRDGHLRLHEGPGDVPFQDAAMYALDWANGTWLAVGATTDVEGLTTGSAAWTSRDGLIWSRTARSPGTGDALTRLVGSERGFVTLSLHGVRSGIAAWRTTTWLSVDGLHWTKGGVIKGGVDGLADDGAGLFATGLDSEGAAIWSSPDGKSWTRMDAPREPDGEMAAIGVYSDGLLAVGHRGLGPDAAGIIWSSSDGKSWMPVDVLGRAHLNDIVEMKDRTVIVGDTGDEFAISPVVFVSHQ